MNYKITSLLFFSFINIISSDGISIVDVDNNQNGINSFQSVPLEIVLTIANFMKESSDILALSTTCKFGDETNLFDNDNHLAIRKLAFDKIITEKVIDEIQFGESSVKMLVEPSFLTTRIYFDEDPNLQNFSNFMNNRFNEIYEKYHTDLDLYIPIIQHDALIDENNYLKKHIETNKLKFSDKYWHDNTILKIITKSKNNSEFHCEGIFFKNFAENFEKVLEAVKSKEQDKSKEITKIFYNNIFVKKFFSKSDWYQNSEFNFLFYLARHEARNHTLLHDSVKLNSNSATIGDCFMAVDFIVTKYPELCNCLTASQETALHYFIRVLNIDEKEEYNKGIISKLLQSGIDTTIKDCFGKTALDYAEKNNLPEIIKQLLLDHEKNKLNSKNNSNI